MANRTTPRGARRSTPRSARIAEFPSPSADSAKGLSLPELKTLQTLLSRLDYSRAMGQTFGGKRDLYEALGYKRTLTIQDYLWRYQRNGIAKSIVEILPKATWRGGAELVEDDTTPEPSTPFEKAVVELFAKHKVWQTVLAGDILSRIGRFGAILIGAPGSMDQELPRGNPNALGFFAAYSEADIEVETYVEDNANPRYGLPETYSLRLRSSLSKIQKSSTASRADTKRTVHWTRVVHIAEGVLDDRIFARPALECVWNDLDDLEKLKGAGPEAFWQRAQPGMQFNLDPEMVLSPQEVQAFSEHIDAFMHGQRRYFRTRGVDAKQFAANVAQMAGDLNAIMMIIAASTRIPQRILEGSERGQLASEQDRANWNDRVSDRRAEHGEPVIRQLADRLIAYRYLPQPESYAPRWPEMENLDENEQVEVIEALAKANQAQAAATGQIIVTSNEMRDRILKLPPLEDVIEEDPTGVIEAEVVDQPTQLLIEAAAGTTAPAWRVIQRVAGTHEGRILRAVRRAMREGAEAFDTARIEELLARGARVQAGQIAEDAVDAFEDALAEGLPDRLLAVLDASGAAAARLARRRGTLEGLRTAAALDLSFDAKNPEAIRWAEAHSSQLIVEIGAETRAAVQQVIARSLREGISAPETARILRDVVGLRADQADAVLNLRAKILSSPGQRLMMGKVAVRVPAGGANAAFVEKTLARYSQKLLRDRTLLIARTEIIAAANEGQRQLWLQAVDQGLLQGNEERVWIATTGSDRTCPHCLGMNGQRVGLREEFHSVSLSKSVIGPPLHPACRCATGIAEVRQQEQQERPPTPEPDWRVDPPESIEALAAAVKASGVNFYQGVFYGTRDTAEQLLAAVVRLEFEAAIEKARRGFFVTRTDTGQAFGPNGWK